MCSVSEHIRARLPSQEPAQINPENPPSPPVDDTAGQVRWLRNLKLIRQLTQREDGIRHSGATFRFMGNQYVTVDENGGELETWAGGYHMEEEGSPIDDLLLALCYTILSSCAGRRIHDL